MAQWRGGGDEAARWGRCASERRLRRGRRALSCGTAWTDTRGHLARERSTRATGVGRARGMAGKWARESGVRAACVRWMVGRGVSETGGKTCDARGTGVRAERGCDSCSRNVDPRWQREEEESAGSCWRSRLLEARWAAVTRGEGGAGHAGGGPGAWAVQRSAERVLAR